MKLVIVFLFFGMLFGGSGSAIAQDASHAPGPEVPDPAECMVEPRSEQELRVLIQDAAATPDGSPPASPVAIDSFRSGKSADEQVATEINAEWREFIACINAGDYTRIFAMQSDDKLRADFVQDLASGATEDDLIMFFTATPEAFPPEFRAPFIPLTDFRILEDGRVSAVGPGETGQGEVLVFVKEADRWLVDEQFDLAPGEMPDAGTPAA